MTTDKPRSLKYRPHLDGLRAVAVLMVFVFHANQSLLQGGFIGVDVFFVLSGYLITRVFLRRREAESHESLWGFYARRSRRLFPAMFVLVTAVTIQQVVWGSILDAANRAKDVVSTLLYVANWNFIAQAGDYFAAEGDASPLRHAWSLAVEEQFYILFPAILLLALFLGRQRWSLTPMSLAVLALVSFVLMVVMYSPSNVARVYYGTDTRAHQLLIGAVGGYLFHRYQTRGVGGPVRHRALASFLAGSSLLGIIAMAFLITGSSPFYFNGGTVVIALLTMVLITSTELVPDSLTARALSWRPAVGLGKISYGFYLYHWPIILWITAPAAASFAERRAVNAIQFVMAIVAAVASYYLIEIPVRERRGSLARLPSGRTVALGVGASVAVAVLFGFMLFPKAVDIASADVPAFGAPSDVAISEANGPAGRETTPTPTLSADAEAPETPVALATPDEIIVTATRDKSFESCPDQPHPCVKYEPSDDPSIPTVVLIGDSTAQSYDPTLKALAEQYGFRYVQAAIGGCPISHRLLATGSGGELHKAQNYVCWEELPLIYAESIETWDPELFLATSWNETSQHVEEGVLIEAQTPEHFAAVESGLRDVIETLTENASLAFIDMLPPGPEIECVLEADPSDRACSRSVLPASFEKGYNAIFALLAAETPRVASATITDVICPESWCPLMIDGTVVRYDRIHFTETAARRLAPVLFSRLKQSGVDLANLSHPEG